MDALTYERGQGRLFDDLLETFTETDIEPGQEWLLKFRHLEHYDWDDANFKKRNRGAHAFLPVPLTQGFFFIVPKWAYKKMTQCPDGSPKRWHAKIDRDKHTGKIVKVYARRRGRPAYGEPQDVYAHRELLGLIESKRVVDHMNGWSLDDRCKKNGGINLDAVSARLNVTNGMPRRRKNHELLRGVEPKGYTKDGRQLYVGIFSRRPSKKRSITVRSKRKWTSQLKAHQWYCNQMKRRFNRETWAFDKATLSYPIFPPLMESEVEVSCRSTISTAELNLVATF